VGLISKKYVEEDVILAIWEITEDYDTLISELNLIEEDLKRVESFKNYQRKTEWLSVRTLLKETLGKECRIVYGPERKPYLADNSYNISISHSKNLTAVLLSKTKRVGLDLEFMDEKIKRIADKFLRQEELEEIVPEKEIYHLYLHWCAKEALYKINDKEDINFVTNLFIEPFHPKKEGKLAGFVDNSFMHERFTLQFFNMKNYAIVWCVKN